MLPVCLHENYVFNTTASSITTFNAMRLSECLQNVYKYLQYLQNPPNEKRMTCEFYAEPNKQTTTWERHFQIFQDMEYRTHELFLEKLLDDKC